MAEGALKGAKSRRQRTRVAAATAAVVAAVAIGFSLRPVDWPVPDPIGGLPTPSTAPVDGFPRACVPQELQRADGFIAAFPTGGDPSGRYMVGILDAGNDNRRAAIWTDGKVQLTSPPGREPGFQNGRAVMWRSFTPSLSTFRSEPGRVGLGRSTSTRTAP